MGWCHHSSNLMEQHTSWCCQRPDQGSCCLWVIPVTYERCNAMWRWMAHQEGVLSWWKRRTRKQTCWVQSKHIPVVWVPTLGRPRPTLHLGLQRLPWDTHDLSVYISDESVADHGSGSDGDKAGVDTGGRQFYCGKHFWVLNPWLLPFGFDLKIEKRKKRGVAIGQFCHFCWSTYSIYKYM